MTALNPHNTIFVGLSFEGPDVYSQAGGLGVRMTELTRALAEWGYETHLYFVGDPNKPGEEKQYRDMLTLHRWCQWISNHHPNGVYDGEERKIFDYENSIPQNIIDNIVRPAAYQNRTVVVLAEEWHTARTVINLHNYLNAVGLRDRVIMFWNANNTYGFWNVDWAALNSSCTVTTVSRYMKHIMWKYDLNPMAIPNGIPRRFLDPLDRRGVDYMQSIFHDRFFLVKIGRYTPDKRWIMAVETVANLKDKGVKSTLIMRGGLEPHRAEVMEAAYLNGLSVKELTYSDVGGRSFTEITDAIIRYREYDIIELNFFVPEEFLKYLYASCDAVLANSGHEPFGIVGLEVMALGGIPFVGNSGEDYARAFQNALVVESDDPGEIAAYLMYLSENPRLVEKIRHQAKMTAEMYTWDRIIEDLLGKLEYIGRAFGVGHFGG
ncbi:MAG: glycosyltransferase family 4 protein [Firmicutes bacterium]|nr:glycosyltransferase family 4 protein [Bacillota bacterium]